MKFLFQCPCCACFCFMKPKTGKPKAKETPKEQQCGGSTNRVDHRFRGKPLNFGGQAVEVVLMLKDRCVIAVAVVVWNDGGVEHRRLSVHRHYQDGQPLEESHDVTTPRLLELHNG
ncbi:hypothetical protein FRX31_031822 [Thalictrum thalictroides]|uniref:Uncharacterized protein n=1 Tax=Thalictrum thalictroides TaxID=46969 RepID=A0A7J6V1D6_THATH|nr:hypothetical protein FRX31_031822 [Thalictrum thalictroides]